MCDAWLLRSMFVFMYVCSSVFIILYLGRIDYFGARGRLGMYVRTKKLPSHVQVSPRNQRARHHLHLHIHATSTSSAPNARFPPFIPLPARPASACAVPKVKKTFRRLPCYVLSVSASPAVLQPVGASRWQQSALYSPFTAAKRCGLGGCTRAPGSDRDETSCGGGGGGQFRRG